MIKIKQNAFGENGNCFAACIASLLEIPFEEISDFIATTSDWQVKLNKRIKKYGLTYTEFKAEDLFIIPDYQYVILSGRSPRNRYSDHAVIAKMILTGEEPLSYKWEYIHDPHPDDTFIETVTFVGVFTPIDLGEFVRYKRHDFDDCR